MCKNEAKFTAIIFFIIQENWIWPLFVQTLQIAF